MLPIIIVSCIFMCSEKIDVAFYENLTLARGTLMMFVFKLYYYIVMFLLLL